MNFAALSNASETYFALSEIFRVTSPGCASQSCIIYGIDLIFSLRRVLQANNIGADT